MCVTKCSVRVPLPGGDAFEDLSPVVPISDHMAPFAHLSGPSSNLFGRVMCRRVPDARSLLT
jgi:hypothetical protein